MIIKAYKHDEAPTSRTSIPHSRPVKWNVYIDSIIEAHGIYIQRWEFLGRVEAKDYYLARALAYVRFQRTDIEVVSTIPFGPNG